MQTTGAKQSEADLQRADVAVHRWRPYLTQGRADTERYLFVNRDGSSPISHQTLYIAEIKVTKVLCGVAINPHFFRTILSTHCMRSRKRTLGQQDALDLLSAHMLNSPGELQSTYVLPDTSKQSRRAQQMVYNVLGPRVRHMDKEVRRQQPTQPNASSAANDEPT